MSFFVKKLLKEESFIQAQQWLVRTAEEQHDWLDDEELQWKREKVTGHKENIYSQ